MTEDPSGIDYKKALDTILLLFAKGELVACEILSETDAPLRPDDVGFPSLSTRRLAPLHSCTVTLKFYTTEPVRLTED